MWKFKELIIKREEGEVKNRFQLLRGKNERATEIREMEAIAMGDETKFHIGKWETKAAKRSKE